jgi:two-component system chemotaxis response regulator CheB
VEGGVFYLGAGEEYVTVRPHGNGLVLQVNPAPFISISERKGSINMLMFSLAEVMGDRSAGIILSGSGEDGAEGLAEIIRTGGTAIVQDPKTCLYKEMTRTAMDRCEADLVIPDTKIASEINNFYV